MHISIIDDQSLFREGLKHILDLYFSELLKPIVSTHSSYEFDELINQKSPDFVFIDINSRYQNPLSLIRFYVKKNVPVVVISNETSKNIVIGCLRLGIKGYLHKSMSTQDIVRSMAMIFNGESYIHHSIAALLIDDFKRLSKSDSVSSIKIAKPNLTRREWEVLSLLSHGCSTQNICEKLNIKDKTLKNHVSRILKKLKVKDRTAAVVTALKNNWV